MTAYEELLEKAYELYKADWCASRGYDLALVQETELKDEEYNGEMYASLGEFEDCEFSDEEYMRALIGEGYDNAMSKIAAEEKYPVLFGYSPMGKQQLDSIQQVADFICKHGQYGDVIVTQRDGAFFLNTIGIYIDRIADMDYREELLKVLIPEQMKSDGTQEPDDAIEENVDYRMEMN